MLVIKNSSLNLILEPSKIKSHNWENQATPNLLRQHRFITDFLFAKCQLNGALVSRSNFAFKIGLHIDTVTGESKQKVVEIGARSVTHRTKSNRYPVYANIISYANKESNNQC